jgi:hypothetical protein
MLGVFAEFERAIIQERLRTGLRRAKAEGKKLRRPRITKDLETKILADLNAPGRIEGVRKIAKQFGVDPGTVQRISRRECRDAPRQSRGQSSPQNDLSVFEFGSPWRTKLEVGIFDIVRPRDGGQHDGKSANRCHKGIGLFLEYVGTIPVVIQVTDRRKS